MTDAPPLNFNVGPVQVTVFPALAGRLARFMLYRVNHASPAPTARVLIGSGSTDDTASCIQQATRAAQRSGVAR